MPISSDSLSTLNRLRLPDLWQHEALQALRDGLDVIVDAPTGAGKTYIFELFAKEKAGKSQFVYTVPTRALANDKFMEWKRAGWKVGIATGDVALDTDAPVLVATLETQRERLLRGDGPALLVIDEYQMLADEGRGMNYETTIALAPPSTRLLLLSGSVANPQDVAAWLDRLGRENRVVRTTHRPVPLDDMHVAGLPRSAPSSVTGFFPRLAYGVCLSDLAPLLIFAPQRAAAERIAKQIAGALPDDLPLVLPSAMRACCPAELRAMLEKRVAFHHSGLPYAARAGVIEPLAKAGQLRVIVATMGLAAGINFSVRSVFVSGRSYRDGPYHKEITADELLQMFGRAGRRGLDEAGTVLTADETPRLSDAKPARLTRQSSLDWPSLLRVMGRAAEDGQSPFLAASSLAKSLFSPQPPSLGWETPVAGQVDARLPVGGEESPFAHAPVWREMLNADGQWERAPAGPVTKPLARCLARVGDEWLPAQRVASVVAPLLPGARPSKLVPLKNPERWKFGLELAMAHLAADGTWQPTRTLMRLARLPNRHPFHRDHWESALRKKALRQAQGAGFWDESWEHGVLRVRLDPANIPMDAWMDQSGQALLFPPMRNRAGGDDLSIIVPHTGESRLAAPGSVARAWRKLGLIEADGRPTPRGRVASLFQRGEGLAIAAALEDESYAVEELIWHVANLRGGYRFADTATGESARLAVACRRAYGSLDYPGYLELGLPAGYGDGAGDHLLRLLVEGKSSSDPALSPGDLDRARVEWLSLVRHIVHAKDLDIPRWRDLKAVAAHVLKLHGQNAEALAPMLAEPIHLPEVALYLRRGR